MSENIEIVDDFNPKGLLFVCIEKDKTKDNRKKDNCFFTVFNQRGELVELVFEHQKKDGSITTEKIVSPLYSASKTKLMDSLGLTEQNFMTKQQAMEKNYFDSRKTPLTIYKKCHCLKYENVLSDDKKCDANACVSPTKILLIKNKSYYNGENEKKKQK